MIDIFFMCLLQSEGGSVFWFCSDAFQWNYTLRFLLACLSFAHSLKVLLYSFNVARYRLGSTRNEQIEPWD